MKAVAARLEWSLYVNCPHCEKLNDLSDGSHDQDHEVARRIFTNAWDKLEGHEVECEHCGYEFTLEKVEY